jgi:hypothetical protein
MTAHRGRMRRSPLQLRLAGLAPFKKLQWYMPAGCGIARGQPYLEGQAQSLPGAPVSYWTAGGFCAVKKTDSSLTFPQRSPDISLLPTWRLPTSAAGGASVFTATGAPLGISGRAVNVSLTFRCQPRPSITLQQTGALGPRRRPFCCINDLSTNPV